MVKADGYGLGAARVVEALRPTNPWGFGVATVEEGAVLRAAGADERIVVFSPCGPRDADDLLREGLEPVVTSVEAMSAYAATSRQAGTPLSVHLEIDTGMGRAGLPAESLESWFADAVQMLQAGALRLESTFSHFHSAESAEQETREQWESYERVLGRLEAADVGAGALHMANSAAALRFPDFRADVIRPGIFLYGGGRAPAPAEVRSENVVSIRARVLDVRELAEGSSVSYGATYITPSRSRVATLGIGYADGLPHSLSNRGTALLGGHRVPIRGAVCMDVTVVDVTDLKGVSSGSVATLLGADGAEVITLEELAERAGRLEYEVVTGLGARLPRISVDRGRDAGEAGTRVATADAAAER
jgi:alanine racemase